MTTPTVYPRTSGPTERVTLPWDGLCDEPLIDRTCLVLSSDPKLIGDAQRIFTLRCFRFDDYCDVAEAARVALFSPPSLAIVDMRLAELSSEREQCFAFCKQIVTERTAQIAVIACADDEPQERLLQALAAVYLFPRPPSFEEMESLATIVATCVRAQQRRATLNLLRRTANRRRRPFCERHRRAAA